MPVSELKEYLDNQSVKYVSITHSRAYTAQETAESAHIPGGKLAKTVIVKIDGKMAMAVLPASEHVDLDLLKGAADAESVELATEQEFKDLFPHCEIGAMPPFGNLYNMKVYVEESLTDDEEISFNAGSHTELVQMQYRDYEKLVSPKIINFIRELV